MTRILACLAALLCALPAFAQPSAPPAQYPCGRSTRGCQQIVPRNHTGVWMPFSAVGQTVSAGTFANNGTTGRMAILTFEVPDDYDAVQLVFGNGGANPWTMTQAVVSSAASWQAPTEGITAIDEIGNINSAWLPATFNNAGNQQPAAFPEPLTNFNGVTGSSGAVVALATSAITAAGNATLTFANTTPTGQFQTNPARQGMYVSDMRGCITPGTKASSQTTTTIVLDTVAAAQCNTGQLIFFSWQPISSFSATVPGSPNGDANLVFSDWIPLSSRPRMDGGFVVGETVTGAGIAANSVVQSIDVLNAKVTLNNPTTGVAAAAPITFAMSPTAAATITGGNKLYLSSTTSIFAGETCSNAGLPASDLVTYVGRDAGGQFILLSTAPTGTVSAGSTVTCSHSGFVSAVTAAGSAVLNFFSVTGNRIFMARAFTDATSTPWIHSSPTQFMDAATTQLGIPKRIVYAGPAGVDGVNFIGNVLSNTAGTNTTGGQTPIWAVAFKTRHRGVQLLTIGDSVIQGATTIDQATNFACKAAVDMTTPTLPVWCVNAGIGSSTENQYLHQGMQFIQAYQPNLVVLQGWSRNGFDSVNSYIGRLASISDYVTRYGGRTVVATQVAARSRNVYNLPIARAVTAETAIPLVMGLYNAFANSGGGYAVTALAPNQACVPGGTTLSVTAPSNIVTTSVPITCPAGTVLTLSIVSATTNGTTTVTLGTPSPVANLLQVAGVNIAAGSTLTVTQGSTTATLSIAATGSGATTLTLSSTETAITQNQMTQANGLLRSIGDNATNIIFDGGTIIEDPNDPTWYCPVCSVDGVHPSGNGILMQEMGANGVQGFLPLLRTLIGN